MSEQGGNVRGLRTWRRIAYFGALIGSLLAVPVVLAAEREEEEETARRMEKREEAIRERVDDFAKEVVYEVDIDKEQKAELRQILDGLANDLVELDTKNLEVEAKFHAALTADPVDEAALEAARVEAMTLWEEQSKLFVNAIYEVAEALTPEQRKEFVTALSEMHEG